MKIKKISYVKGYKSFVDFKWADFCVDRNGNEMSFNPYNVIFGENGSGKSSICEILKDLSENKSFSDNCDKPNSINVKIDSDFYNYSANVWDNYLPKNSILFFDQTFIDENVHTNGERSNERNKHSQNSGKLLIELDAEANRKKQIETETTKALKDFEEIHTIKLNQTFLPKDLEIYATFKEKSEEDLTALREEIFNKHKKSVENIDQLKLRKNQTSNVASYNAPDEIKFDTYLQPISTFEEIFSRKIEDLTSKIASSDLSKHIINHKEFIENGLHILELDQNKDSCPFCLQSLKSQENIINSYSAYFNTAYKEQKAKYITDIESLKSHIDVLSKITFQLINIVLPQYDTLSDFWKTHDVAKFVNEFSIELNKEPFDESLSIAKKLGSLSIQPDAFKNLISELDKLKSLEELIYDFHKDYSLLESYVKENEILIRSVNESFKTYRKIINTFKEKYSDVSIINQEIEQKEPELNRLLHIKEYFENNLHLLIKEYNKVKEEQEVLKVACNSAKDDLKAYIITQAPSLILSKMMIFLKKFNLSFSLEPNRITGSTTEVPFSFKILDVKGKERNIKTGLSEGERQLISLAFFFAINENTTAKGNKILIFDDPITSLDASNLKILSDVIFEQINIYSQVFVFTHHPLFYKYLIKKENPNPNKFGILKNTIAFKGSLIYVDSEFDLHNQLKGIHQSLIGMASAGTLSIEEATISYGHLLRLSVERFIKNELLLWNKEDNFSTLTGGLKDAKSKIKQLSDIDLDTIEKVYKYCNYSNFLHADKETSSALTELLQQIDKYIAIIDAVRIPIPLTVPAHS